MVTENRGCNFVDAPAIEIQMFKRPLGIARLGPGSAWLMAMSASTPGCSRKVIVPGLTMSVIDQDEMDGIDALEHGPGFRR